MNADVTQTERPRNVNAFQAAALLYGDWGTSKAYVIGLAFVVAGHASVWLIAGVSLLSILIGLNYILICKYYPHGGGVYASVRHRSELLALMGGFFLVCDYIITAAISAISAFSYLGVASPEIWSIGAIAFVGVINYFGPRHTGSLAFIVAMMTFVIVAILGVFSLLHINEAIAATTPLTKSIRLNWIDFVSVIVALSGIEAIANMTGVMQLDPGSTQENPSVVKTSTPAIIAVMLEVSFFTALFSLSINALPGLRVQGEEVMSSSHANLRDYMLKYMGEVFAGSYFGNEIGIIFGYAISIVFGVLLLSAVNTAIVAFNSVLFIMAKDGQLPSIFNKINRFGVPTLALIISTLSPILVLLFVNDMVSLAHLYAIGFVGAIATNLGATSTNKKINMKKFDRALMFITFILMAAIEITLFIEKPHARAFVVTVVAIGLLFRGLVLEQRAKQKQLDLASVSKVASRLIKAHRTYNPPDDHAAYLQSISKIQDLTSTDHLHTGALLCAVTHIGKTLEYALEQSKISGQKLFILFVREQKILLTQNGDMSWVHDEHACKIFDYCLDYLVGQNISFLYGVGDAPDLVIIEHATKLHVSRVILGMPRTNKLLQILRGDVVSEVFRKLPPSIDLIVMS